MKIVVTLTVTDLHRSICVYSLSFRNMCLMTLNSEHAQKCALSNVSALPCVSSYMIGSVSGEGAAVQTQGSPSLSKHGGFRLMDS